MDPYVMYLFYVVAVIGFFVLLLRRNRQRQLDFSAPDIVGVSLLRGGPGAVVETMIFELNLKKNIELKTGGAGRKLLTVVLTEHQAGLSVLEEAVIQSFTAIQGNMPMLKKARRHLAESLRETEEVMEKAGWWKKQARWHWILTVLAPGLIVVGSLRFLHAYEGGLQWALALTVPFLAVLGRRIVRREMSGPTEKGKNLLERLRRERMADPDPLWQVALNGTQVLSGNPEYRLFCFMMRGIPYWKL